MRCSPKISERRNCLRKSSGALGLVFPANFDWDNVLGDYENVVDP